MRKLFAASALLLISACATVEAPSSEAPTLSFAEVRARMDPAISLPGVNVIANNGERVVIGILSAADRQAALDFATQAGVPESRLEFRIFGPIRVRRTLRDLQRPSPAGVQIGTMQGFCTQGPVAIPEATGEVGFITNSHCTPVRGVVDQQNFGQPNPGFAWSSLLATETIDPPMSTTLPGCAAGFTCRRSDAVFASRVGNVPSSHFWLGHIAEPAQMCQSGQTCGLDLTNPTDALTIVGLGNPSIGDRLGKIGRTSGWTVGTVSATCANAEVFDEPGVMMLCQTFVDGHSIPGDSGSPVFSLLQNHQAVLFGLLWGGSEASPGMPETFVFSPIDNVVAEIGPMRFN